MRGLRKHLDGGFENPLFKRDDWYQAALDAFSQQPFGEVSLNQILKAAGINKGSFYYKFYDKLDLYLCMMERGAEQKAAFLLKQLQGEEQTKDFFDQLRLIAKGSLQFAAHDRRFYVFWRTYLGDSELIKSKVRESFPDIGDDFLGKLIAQAIKTGQINDQFDAQFVQDVVNLYFTNMDHFIDVEMTDEQIMQKTEQVIVFLEASLKADR